MVVLGRPLFREGDLGGSGFENAAPAVLRGPGSFLRFCIPDRAIGATEMPRDHRLDRFVDDGGAGRIRTILARSELERDLRWNRILPMFRRVAQLRDGLEFVGLSRLENRRWELRLVGGIGKILPRSI